MGGFFGTISKSSCVTDLFYGTDYNSHLGTRRGGMATYDKNAGFIRSIHNLENSYFRTKFEAGLPKFSGNAGIGIISDTDAQPIVINSHLGKFAIVTVAKINNIDELEKELLAANRHFSELSSGKTNQTELVALLITQGKDFVEGIVHVSVPTEGAEHQMEMLVAIVVAVYIAIGTILPDPVPCVVAEDGKALWSYRGEASLEITYLKILPHIKHLHDLLHRALHHLIPESRQALEKTVLAELYQGFPDRSFADGEPFDQRAFRNDVIGGQIPPYDILHQRAVYRFLKCSCRFHHQTLKNPSTSGIEET